MPSIKSALELFGEYERRGRYRGGIMFSAFSLGRGPADADRFYLQLMRGITEIEHRPVVNGYPYVDLHAAGISTSIQFESTNPRSYEVQTLQSLWKTIKQEFVQSRHYSIRVAWDDPQADRSYVPLRLREDFPARIICTPALKRGMVINPPDQVARVMLHWSAFIPEGTPEYEVVFAANDLACVCNTGGLKPEEAEVKRLQDEVRAKIELVPA